MKRIASWITAILFIASASAVAQDKYFVSHGVRIRYVDQGAGEPVVLLHGLGGDVEPWSSVGILQDLAGDHPALREFISAHPAR